MNTLRRFLTLPLAVAALLIAVAAPAPAQEANPATGTAEAFSALVSVEVGGGDVADITLLGQVLRAALSDDPLAVGHINPLSVSSQTIPGLDVAAPTIETSSNGPTEHNEPLVPLDSPVTSGGIAPLNLSSIVGDDVRSALQLKLAQLDVLGGIVGLSAISDDVTTVAGSAASDASRTFSIDAVGAFDLLALAQGIGLPLDQLPLGTLTGLLDQLGVLIPLDSLPVEDLVVLNQLIGADASGGLSGSQLQSAATNAGDVAGNIETGLTELADLLSVPTTTRAKADDPLTGLLEDPPVLGDLGDLDTSVLTEPIAESCDPSSDLYQAIDAVLDAEALCAAGDLTPEELIAALEDLLNTLQDLLAGLLDLGVVAAADAPLVQINAVTAALQALATDNVDTSKAAVDASLGTVVVGGTELPVSVDDLVALANQATSALRDVLTIIDPGLADLLAVEFLVETESVTKDDATNTITSLAQLDIIKVTVTPPALLGDIVDGIVGQTGVADLLASSPLSALSGSGAKAAEPGLLGTVAALTQPTSVAIGTFGQAAVYTPGSTTTPTSNNPQTNPENPLPRTGSSDTVMLVAALGLGLAAIGIRRSLRAES